MAATIENYQYVWATSDAAAGYNVMLLAGQDLLVYTLATSNTVSVVFTGVELSATTGAETNKVGVGSYPDVGSKILLYSCPVGTNAVGRVTVSGDPYGTTGVIIAVSVDTPLTQTTIDASLLPNYEKILGASLSFGVSANVSNIIMLAGQSIAVRGLGATVGAEVAVIVMGREFDSEGTETPINTGSVLSNVNTTGLLVYICPTGKTAIVSVSTVDVYDDITTPTVTAYLHGIDGTTDPDGGGGA